MAVVLGDEGHGLGEGDRRAGGRGDSVMNSSRGCQKPRAFRLRLQPSAAEVSGCESARRTENAGRIVAGKP